MFGKTLSTLLLLVFAAGLPAQENTQNDSAMQQFIVHFSLGSDWNPDLPPQEQTGFAEHSANMQQLRAQGTTLFGARYEALGMLIIQAPSAAAAEQIIKADPAVVSGIFNYSLSPVSIFYPWKESAIAPPDPHPE